MRPLSLTVPELALIAGTRAALGAGVAMLVSDRLNPEQRRAIGWTLLAVGVISTAPIAAEIIARVRSRSRTRSEEPDDIVEADVI
jgi:multisubunit Na+/H+ antiporter MnhG subunit